MKRSLMEPDTKWCMAAYATFAVALHLLPMRAAAQDGAAGSIVGSVFDEAGQPLRGVKVTARSATQIGGQKTTYTTEEGSFRFPGLQPGTFEITASATKLKTLVQKDVKVGVNAPAEVNLVMPLQTSVEEVTVFETAPIVSTTTASVKTIFDEEFVDSLPVETKSAMEAFVGANTPGAYYNGIRTARIRGGGSEQNAFLMEGFYTNGHKVTLKSLAAMEVQTAGYGAENANVPGGVINMVTKSGSNNFELDVSGFHEDSALTFFTDSTDITTRQWNWFLNPAVSGPVIKDRLWFYLNTELRSQMRYRDADPSGLDLFGDPPPRSNLVGRAHLKLTWQLTPRNRLQSFTNLSGERANNEADPFSHEPDAQRFRSQADLFQGFTWEALLAHNILFKSQLGYSRIGRETEPQLCRTDADGCDHIPQIRNASPKAIRYNNSDLHELEVRQSQELINTLEWFTGGKLAGEHAIKLRSRFFFDLQELSESTPGDHYIQLNGTSNDRRRTFFANDPRLEKPRFGWRITGTSALTTVHSLSDSIRLTRWLTFNPGLAFTTVSAHNVGEEDNIRSWAITPHLAVAWDATHDGRTVLRASFNQYVDTDALRLARFALGERVFQECLWNPVTQDYSTACRFGGGATNRTFGLPCGPTGIDADGSSCDERLKIPQTWEYTAGAEREIVPGVALGADLVYRLYTYPYENRETNLIWNQSGTGLDRTGEFRNGRNESVSDLGTPADARRRYLGVTASLAKREGALKVSAAYTWARLQGNVNNSEGNEFGDNPAKDRFYLYGDLPDDSRHTFKTALTYRLTPWLTTGVVHRYLSGRPHNRRFPNDVLGTSTDLRARVGVNPGSNINDPGDDRPLRLPDIHQLNLQLRAGLRPLLGIELEGFMDFLNFLALRPHVAVNDLDGPTFGTPGPRVDPFKVRVGFRYKY